MGTRVYSTLDDEIKKRTFKVVIPESYQPHIPAYFLDTQTASLNDQPSGAMSLARLTMVHIVDMCFKGVEFRIPEYLDAVKMVTLLESYLKDTAAIRGKDPDTDVFLERCSTALGKLQLFVKRRKRVNERQLGQVPIQTRDVGNILQEIAKVTGGRT